MAMGKQESSVTIKDIAKLANTSYSSVSRALSNSGGVSEKTRAKILKIAQELGYKPNALARSLVKQQTDTIGLIVPDLTNPFFAEIAQSVFEAVARRGFSTILGMTGWDPAEERRSIEMMLQKRVDGIILKFVQSGKRYDFGDTPVILLERSKKLRYGYVEIDDEYGGYQAAKYMLACGYRKIVIVGGTSSSTSHCLRISGFRRAFEEAGYGTDSIEILFGSFSLSSGAEIMNKRLKAGERPEAAFCANDAVALGVLQSVKEHGLCVPRDFGVMGFDDIAYASLPQILLTTVRQPLYEMGGIASSLLIDQIERGRPDTLPKVVLEPGLIVRNTCRSPKDQKEEL